MDETDKLIIFTFSGATMLIGCLVITCACIFSPNIEEKQDPETQNNNHETADITRVSMVVTQELINATKNNNIDLGKTENEQDTSNEKIDNIIQNFRESLTHDTEASQFEDRNNIMLTFTPQHLIRGPHGEIYDPHQESETDF